MDSDKRYSPLPSTLLRRPAAPLRRPPGEHAALDHPTALDWPAWLSLLERKRRLCMRRQKPIPLWVDRRQTDYFVDATCASFKLDGIDISGDEVLQALQQGPAQRKLQSRAAQRIRNHVAILHSIEISLRLSHSLKTSNVIRWYTSISSGLSMTPLGNDQVSRLDHIAGRINSPQLQLQPAIQEIARTHAELLSDPLLPSFNGILSRLLLRFHVGRCGLPCLRFEPNHGPPQPPYSEADLTLQLLAALSRGYDSWIDAT